MRVMVAAGLRRPLATVARTDQTREAEMKGYWTSDGVPITDGLVVWDYDLDLARVSFTDTTGVDSAWGFDGWFTLRTVQGDRRKLMNGARMTTRHPFTRQGAASAAENIDEAAP